MAIAHYGQDFVRHFRADAISQLAFPRLKQTPLLVSRVRHESPGHGFATPAKVQPVFSVLLQLRTQHQRELFLGERCVHRGAYAARTISIVDHLERPRANLLSAFDTLIFTVPRAALDEIADDNAAPRIDHIACERGLVDEAMWHLGQALLPALDRPHEVGLMYAEHTMLAINSYIAHRFGGLRIAPHQEHGSLAPWQLRRATEMMMSNLAGDTTLAELATHCGLSRSYFVRAFKRSTGDPPHRWLQRRRVELSKKLLRETQMGLAEISLASGFSDQSHFTRVFSAQVGKSPGSWRRESKN